ncbi:cupin [Sphingobium sp. C100]|uniref:hypothetical protein n=1 Tax=Sphingobium sp. C100 TaxID=1207055 RepID=UPI0003D6592E|nr:hypothetical protein [Sphingobium sp. C100]ETI64294.1 cupin [Sphingobium sp. C100]
MAMFAPFQRIVTGHDDAGLSRVMAADDIVPALIPSGDAGFALVWTSRGMPVDHRWLHVDAADTPSGLRRRQCTVLRMVDLLPGSASPMHRTNSLDYGIVICGALELELEDGSVTRMPP